ncbi:MAG: DUF1648 domain-containing protein, partial [Bacteroidota bacterium]
EERPKLTIDWQPIDWLIETIGAIALVLMILLPILYLGILPDEVPRHFNAAGEADAMGSKNTIFLLSGIGFLMYISLWYLNKFPHTFNFPTKITKENAYIQYQNATRMMRTVNTFIAISFAYITYMIIQNGLGNANGLGRYFTPIFLGLTFLIVFLGIYNAAKKKPTPA